MAATDARLARWVGNAISRGRCFPMAIILPPLPYADDALAPVLSATTLQTHHGKHHQAYVDKVMAGLKPEQRAHIVKLWKEKRILYPNMTNRGASFVKILTYISGSKGETEDVGKGNTN